MGAEGSTDTDPGSPFHPIEKPGHIANRPDAQFKITVAERRRGDGKRGLTDTRQLEHDKLSGPEDKVLTLSLVNKLDLIELLHPGQGIDIGDLSLVGILEFLSGNRLDRLHCNMHCLPPDGLLFAGPDAGNHLRHRDPRQTRLAAAAAAHAQ